MSTSAIKHEHAENLIEHIYVYSGCGSFRVIAVDYHGEEFSLFRVDKIRDDSRKLAERIAKELSKKLGVKLGEEQ